MIVLVFLYGAMREMLGLPGPWVRRWEGNWTQADMRLAARSATADFEVRAWFRPEGTRR